MRRLGFIFTLLSLPMAAQTPYGRLNFQLQSAQGQAIAGATVNVYTQAACGTPTAGTQATLYADALGTTPLPQPVITDGFGSGFAYMARGCYTVVYYSGYTGTSTFADQNVLAASSTGSAGGTNTQVQSNCNGVLCGGPATLNSVTGDFSTPGSVTASAIGPFKVASMFIGSDCGARINAADAALGATHGSILADAVCQALPWTTPVTVSAGHSLQFPQGGTFSVGATITLQSNASLYGLPTATNNSPIILQEAAGANLASLVHVIGGAATIQSIEIDGNGSAQNGTTCAGLGGCHAIWVDSANRFALKDSTVMNAQADNLHVTSTANQSCCGRIISGSFLIGAGNDDLYLFGSADWIISTAEFENAGKFGIEGVDSPTARLDNCDIGANGSGGSGGGLSSTGNTAYAGGWQIVGCQFGSNYGNDAYFNGTNGQFFNGSNLLVGNFFLGLHAAVAADTYSSIVLADAGNATIASNFFGGGTPRFQYHISSTTSNGFPHGSIYSGNFMNNGGAQQDYNVLSNGTDGYTGFSPTDAGIQLYNAYLANNTTLLCSDSSHLHYPCIGTSNGKTNISGSQFPGDSATAAVAILPNGTQTWEFDATQTRLANGIPIQVEDGTGTPHTLVLVNNAGNVFFIGNLLHTFTFQPLGGQNTMVLTDQNAAFTGVGSFTDTLRTKNAVVGGIISNHNSTTDTVTCTGASTGNFATTYTIPANYLTANTGLKLFFGVAVTTGSAPPQIGLNLSIGGVTVYSASLATPAATSKTAMAGGAVFTVDGSAAASASAAVYTNYMGLPDGSGNGNFVPFNFSTTAISELLATNGTLVIQPSLTCSAAGTGTTSLTLTKFTVEQTGW